MADQNKKFSIQEIRAAKERSVMKTAVRPAARPPEPPRSFKKPLLALLAIAALAVAVAASLCHSAWSAASAEAAAFFSTDSSPEPPAAPLASDHELEKLIALFHAPVKLDWLEIEATARLRRTGNARAKRMTETNAQYLERFRSVFPSELGSAADVYKNGAPMLGGHYDLTQLEQMLVSTVAMGHYLLDSGAPIPGEEVLLGAIRAGLMVARGTGGRYSARAFEIGETTATLARLQLLSHAYTGHLAAAETAQLASRLRPTVALEPDFRRVLIAERDRTLAIVDRAHNRVGPWWSWLSMQGYEEPDRLVTRVYTEALDSVLRPPIQALATFKDGAASFDRPASPPLVHPASAPLALFPRVLLHKTVAIGSVAGALLLEKLSHLRTLPDNLRDVGVPLPRDPVTDDPFLYQSLGDTYRFYGVGPDGKDDGGDEVKDVLLLGTPKS